MKICMFTNTYLPHIGGVARSVDFFAQDLRTLGHQVLIVAPVYSEEPKNDRGEELLRVPAIQNFNGSDFSVSIAVPSNISTRITDFQPELIHSHHPYLLGDTALRSARRLNCPLVFTHHTLYEEYTHYVPLDSEGLKRFVIHLSSRYANLCNGVVAPSRSIADLIRSRGVTVPVREIPTGVDLVGFRNGDGIRFRRSYGMPEKEPVIGHVGRLAPEKNLEYLAEAVADCLRVMKGVFLVAGKGPSGEKIRRIFAARNLENRLFLVGEQSGQRLVDAYHTMDIFVFSSKSETQGMVLVEAMAAGIPVIALDAPGAREVVRDGFNGRLLEDNARPDVFAAAIGNFFHHTGDKLRWKNEALKTAGRFSRERCARDLAEFYGQLVEECPACIQGSNEIQSLEKLQRNMKAEWDLIAEKAGALADTLGENA
ncbi:MAG: glycosyltransferase [Deltaproteobacteria bacterium]|nr:glycosyltransferase [Deltaproteobacteria bacterium]